MSAPEETHPAPELCQETPGVGFEDVHAPISKGTDLPQVAKGLSLSQLWRNLQQYLSCQILEPDLLRDAVILCRNPLTALGAFERALLNTSHCPSENIQIWFNGRGTAVV